MNRYRIVLGTAALYNVAFGVWAGLFPLAYFQWFQLELPRYPSIWACLGMVIGLYGAGYAYAAWWLDRGAIFVWIGLAGKVLGPIGWLLAVGRGEFPPRTFPLILANDLIWWFPFLFYLMHEFAGRRRIIAWLCTMLHVAACVGLLIARGGTEMQPNMAARAAWINEWTVVWVATWVAWSLASMSLLALLNVWSERLVELGASRSVTVACCATCAIGFLFDISGETVNITWLTRTGLNVDDFARGARLYSYLGAGIANGLYCVAGLALSTIAWRVGHLRGWLGVLGFAMWTIGLGLTVATLFDYQVGMIVLGGAVMGLFIPWAACLALRLDGPLQRVRGNR